MQKKSIIVAAALSLVLVLGTTAAFAGGAGCNKAKQAAETAGNGTGCCKSATTADGKPCCSRMAMDQAVAALRSAAETSGSPKALEAVQAAEIAVKKAQDTTGCAKSKEAAEEAALVALQNAAELASDPKAKSAVEAALVAHNSPHGAEGEPATH